MQINVESQKTAVGSRIPRQRRESCHKRAEAQAVKEWLLEKPFQFQAETPAWRSHSGWPRLVWFAPNQARKTSLNES